MKQFVRSATDVNQLQLKGLKARKMIAQGKRSNASAALGDQRKTNQALSGRTKREDTNNCLEAEYSIS